MIGSSEHSRESLEAKVAEIESQLKKEQARQKQMQVSELFCFMFGNDLCGT